MTEGNPEPELTPGQQQSQDIARQAAEASRNKPYQPDHLSYSQLSVYQGCGQKYKLSYIDKVPRRPSGFFIGGIAIHEGIELAEQNEWYREPIEEWQKRDHPIYKSFEEKITTEVEKAGGPEAVYWGGRSHGENMQWWLKSGPMFLRRYHQTRLQDLQKGYQMAQGGTEMKIGATLPSGTYLTAYIDAFLMVDPDGQRIIRDYKTGRAGGENGVQLAVYDWLVQQALNVVPAYGEYAYLRDAGVDSRLQQVDTKVLLPLVEPFFADAEKGIRAQLFSMKPSFFCKSCSVKASCPYGQTVKDD